jgi:hypothetical protein
VDRLAVLAVLLSHEDHMRRVLLLGVALAVASVAAPAANAATFSYYAPPAAFGPWQTVNAYTAPTNFTITYQPLGDTTIFGEVRYFDASGNQVVKPLLSGAVYKTGPGLAPVEVRFRGVPFGSGVNGTITP